uniref:AgrB domain-containing protein n=1 Tax=Thalassocalyce inconstans TaxID=140487 RepID=V9PPM0_THAIN|nr:AgrB domain-containing protein [Thalassocalyce inconstans]
MASRRVSTFVSFTSEGCVGILLRRVMKAQLRCSILLLSLVVAAILFIPLSFLLFLLFFLLLLLLILLLLLPCDGTSVVTVEEACIGKGIPRNGATKCSITIASALTYIIQPNNLSENTATAVQLQKH